MQCTNIYYPKKHFHQTNLILINDKTTKFHNKIALLLFLRSDLPPLWIELLL